MAAARLVLAHYFGGSAKSWSPLIPALGEGVKATALDIAGFGGSPAPDAPSLEGYVNDFVAAAPQGEWIAVGHSMGGKIALAAAACRPLGLKAVILIAPSPPTPEPMSEEDRRKTLDAFGSRAEAETHIRDIAPDTITPAVFEQAVKDEISVARSAWTWWLETGSREDISPATDGLDLPCLVITGDDDKVMGLKTPFGVAANLANAEVQVISNAGHLVPLERPDCVAEAIRGFLMTIEERF